MSVPRRLEMGRKEKLGPSDLLTQITWESRADVACDVDLCAFLFDARGRLLEVVDFNNCVSNDRAISHGGDAVSTDTSTKSEHLFIDTRKFHHRVHTVAFTATVFGRTFGDVKLASLDLNLKHLIFVDTTEALRSRSLVSMHPLWTASLKDRGTHELLLDAEANFIVLFALSRGLMKFSGEKQWSVEGVMVQSLSTTRNDATRSAQQALTWYFPWLKDDKKRTFSSVSDVCVALSSHALPDLKPKFQKLEFILQQQHRQQAKKENPKQSPSRKKELSRDEVPDGGLDIDTFVEILFTQLAGQFPVLKNIQEAAMLVALLHELFREIDVNGDERVDWEEFTSHTISTGMQATRSGKGNAPVECADEYEVTYEVDHAYFQLATSGVAATGVTSLSHRPIAMMRYVPELQRILVVEQATSGFDAYNQRGLYQHSHDFGSDDDNKLRLNNSTYYAGASSKKKKKHVDTHCGSYGAAATSAAKVVHDVLYVAERGLVVAALSDHALHLLTEQLSSSGKHRSYRTAGIIVTHTPHRKLVWSSTSDKLLSVDKQSKVYCWNLETAAKKQKFDMTFLAHDDILMDVTFIKEKGLLATCGLDKKIKLWGVENLRHRGTLLGHRLGVRTMACAQSILVSGGFDNDIFVWDVGSRERLAKMAGHRAAICKIEVLAPRVDTAFVVSLDVAGHCNIWRLENSGSHATLAQSFRLPYPDTAAGHCPSAAEAIVIPWNDDCAIDDFFSDIFIGGACLFRMIPVKKCKEFAPPAAAVFNTLSLNFVAAVNDKIHMWDSKTGTYVGGFDVVPPSSSHSGEEPTDKHKGHHHHPSPPPPHHHQSEDASSEDSNKPAPSSHTAELQQTSVSCLCFDEPRQRRLFCGTEGGLILVMNYVTGTVMSGCRAHPLGCEVGGILYCDKTKCVLSYGADRAIVICRDVKSEGLKVLRRVSNAHKAQIALTCFAYSRYLGLICSGGVGGFVNLWDFESVSSLAVLRLSAAVTALATVDPYPLLVAADADGNVFVYHLLTTRASKKRYAFDGAAPLCALTLPVDLPPPSGRQLDELNDDDHDDKSQCSRTGQGKYVAAVTALTPLLITRRAGRSSLQELDESQPLALFAATDSGHIVRWSLSNVLEQFPGIQKLKDDDDDDDDDDDQVHDECDPPAAAQEPSVKEETTKEDDAKGRRRSMLQAVGKHTYRKVTRDMELCESADVVCDASRFLENRAVLRFGPTAFVKAHEDAVLHVCVVADPPCVYSTAADGFQRLWDPATLVATGEFPLPNVSLRALKRRTIPPCDWTYYQRTPLEVGPEHERLALKYVSAAFQSTKETPKIRGKDVFRAAVRKIISINVFGSFLKIDPDSLSPTDAADEWRRRLAANQEKSKAVQLRERAAKRDYFDDVRRRRQNSRDKTALAEELKRKLNRQKALGQMVSMPSKSLPTSSSSSSSKMMMSSSSSMPSLGKSDADLEKLASKLALPPAFSMRSINRGVRAGLYDNEAADHLKDIARFAERRAAYERLGERPFLGGDTTTDITPPAVAVHLQKDAKSGELRPIVIDSSLRLNNDDDDVVSLLAAFSQTQRRISVDTTSFDSTDTVAPLPRLQRVQASVTKFEAAMQAEKDRGDDSKKCRRKSLSEASKGISRSSLDAVVSSRKNLRRRSRASLGDITYEELARPHYTANDITEFRNSFNYVDSDLSGTINIEEWHMFMNCLNQNLTDTESRLLFLHIDRDRDGIVSMRELISIVFQRCKPEQQKLIYHKLLAQNKLEAAQRKQKGALTIEQEFEKHHTITSSSSSPPGAVTTTSSAAAD